MARDADRRSRRPASCWKVDVVKGAAGRRRYGLGSTESTVTVRPSSPSRTAPAAASSSTSTSPVVRPSSSKSRPAATFRPSTSARRAVKPSLPAMARWQVRSQ